MNHKPSSPRWRDLPWVAFDFETTGLDADVDRITQVGVAFDDGAKRSTYQKAARWVNPGRDVPQFVIDGIKLKPSELASIRAAQPLERYASILLTMYDHVPFLCGWNCGTVAGEYFDCAFLQAEAARFGLTPSLRPVIDVKPLAVQILGDNLGSYTLAAVADDLGIPTDGAHRAGDDAGMVLEILAFLAAPSFGLPESLCDLVQVNRTWAELSPYLLSTSDGFVVNYGPFKSAYLTDMAADSAGQADLKGWLSKPHLPNRVRELVSSALEVHYES